MASWARREANKLSGSIARLQKPRFQCLVPDVGESISFLTALGGGLV